MGSGELLQANRWERRSQVSDGIGSLERGRPCKRLRERRISMLFRCSRSRLTVGKKVESIELFTGMSVTQLSRLTGIARETISRRLAEANVRGVEERRGHPVYRPRDALTAIYGAGVGESSDPDGMRPFERKAHYQAEHEKLRLQVERGELVPSIEVEQGHGQIFAIVTQAFDTLPDVLERDVGLSPLQLARVEKHVDETREALYQRLIEGEDDGADSAVADRA